MLDNRKLENFVPLHADAVCMLQEKKLEMEGHLL